VNMKTRYTCSINVETYFRSLQGLQGQDRD